MKYVLIVLFFLAGCRNAIPVAPLTDAETKMIDSLQFDKAVVAEVKGVVKVPFRVMKVENETGRNIPVNLVPGMIYFKAEKTVDRASIERIKEKYNRKGYNIYILDQQDQKATVIISKL